MMLQSLVECLLSHLWTCVSLRVQTRNVNILSFQGELSSNFQTSTGAFIQSATWRQAESSQVPANIRCPGANNCNCFERCEQQVAGLVVVAAAAVAVELAA